MGVGPETESGKGASGRLGDAGFPAPPVHVPGHGKAVEELEEVAVAAPLL